MTELSPRQKTAEAYAQYLRAMSSIAEDEKNFVAHVEPQIKRQSKTSGLIGKWSMPLVPISAVAAFTDVAVSSYDLGALPYLGCLVLGCASSLTFLIHKDETLNKISTESTNRRDRHLRASRDLLNAAAKEISSYGMVVLAQDVENQFITTNQGVVTLATDEQDETQIQLLLDGKVLQPSYHTETRKMKTLRGDVINAPEIIKV